MTPKTLSEILAEESAAHQAFEASTIATADGRTIAELRAAFERVQNREHWKLPIAAEFGRIAPAERKLIAQAIEHFTGSRAEWISSAGGRFWRVEAAGYFAAIGA